MKKEVHYLSIALPPDLFEVVAKRAQANERSLNKEVVRMIRTQLSLEQEQANKKEEQAS